MLSEQKGMSINTAISKWIDKSEPDFYTLFIKAWIPYNSWYMCNFYDEDATPKRTSDIDIINYMIIRKSDEL